LIWTVDFTMKGFFFGPNKKSEVIKLANTQLYDASLFTDIDDAVGNVTPVSKIGVAPGQITKSGPLVNGE